MENTEAFCWMMETGYSSPSPDYWLHNETDFGGLTQDLCNSRLSGSGSDTNPCPSDSVTNLGDVVRTDEKPVTRRRSRAAKKTKPTKHINATAKNFKELVQKHTGRQPRPFTLFGGKGPVILSFDQGSVLYENDVDNESEVGLYSSYSRSPVKPLCANPVQGRQLHRQFMHHQTNTGVMYSDNGGDVIYGITSVDNPESRMASNSADMGLRDSISEE